MSLIQRVYDTASLQSQITAAASAASAAQSTATGAASTASSAASTASSAASTATSAASTASAASTLASSAASTANTASTNATTALNAVNSTKLINVKKVVIPAATIVLATRKTAAVVWDTPFADINYTVVVGVESDASLLSSTILSDLKFHTLTTTGMTLDYNQLLTVGASLITVHIIARHA